MSQLNMLPLPVVQMGLVEKLVEVTQNQPHVQQLVAQEGARQALKAESERVPVLDLPEQRPKIRDRESGRKNREGRQGRDRPSAGQTREQDTQEEAAGAGRSKNGPWAGRIVNMKV